jgi:uncharacterized protein
MKKQTVHSPQYRVVRITSVVFIATAVLYVGLSIFGSIAAMSVPRRPLTASPASVNLQYEDISFYSREDRILLRGWFLPSDGRSVVLIINGGFENRVDSVANTLGISLGLVRNSYNVMLFDLRGRGESGGKGLSMSNIFRDIGGAVDYLVDRGYTADTICIMGFCSGAASACIYASENDVGAIVLDGCFTGVQDMVIKQAEKRRIPAFITGFFFSGVQAAAKIFYDYQVVNPIDVVAKIRCPILFIHEEYDDLISSENSLRLFNASGNSSNEFWQVTGALHSQGFNDNPSLYVEKIVSFLDANLKQ